MDQPLKYIVRQAGITLLFAFVFSSAVFAAATWKTQSTASTDILRDIHAVSATTAYAVGDGRTLLKTTDRGLTWTSKITANSWTIEAVHFPSSQIGYIVGVTGGGASFTYKSTDEGEFWDEIGSSAFPPNDVFFVSTTEGYVCTERTGGSGGVYKRTSSSGWTEAATGLEDRTYYGLYFTDANTGWVVGTSGKVFKTTDAAANWSNKSPFFTITTFRAVYFLNASTGWVVGGSEIQRTTDGGDNWNSINISPFGDSVSFYDVYFVDANNGWAVGELGSGGGAIYKSTDGGANWTSVATPSLPVYGAHFIDQYNGWAVGGNSTLIAKYVVDPTVTSILIDGRNDRPLNWSGTVTIEVTNLQTGATFESDIPIIETARSASSITGTITLSATGVKTITIYNPDTGSGSGTFTVNPLPVVTLANPSTMTQGDTGNVTIAGSSFQTGLTTSSLAFSLAGITVNSLSRESQYKLVANITLAGGATTGTGDISLTNPDGGLGTGIGLFNVSPAGVTGPTVSSVSPTTGTQGATSLDVTITGSNFHAGGNTVVFGNSGITVNLVTRNSSTSIVANLTISATAPTTSRTVTVANTDDGGIGSLSGAFQVIDPNAVVPTITKITPASGTAGWSGYVIITGSGFSYEAASGQGSVVSFSPADNVSVSNTVFVDDTHLRVYLAIDSSAPTGSKDVKVLNPSGTSTLAANAFTINALTDPAALPDKILIIAFPNPWNHNQTTDVTLQFDWPGSADTVKFIWINNEGRTSKPPIETNVTSGRNKVTFDALTQFGDKLPAGMHFVNMINNNKVVGTSKVMVVPW